MEKECEIVQDLLFSYNDGVLSKSSIELVENHLKVCNICKEKLEEIENDNKNKFDNDIKEVDYLKKVKVKLKRRKFLIITALSILSIIILFNIIVFINYKLTPSTLQIYLSDNISEENKYNIENTIKSYENVHITYLSKEDKLEDTKNSLGKNENLLIGWEGDNPFKNSFIIKADKNKIEKMSQSIEKMEGVDSIYSSVTNNPYEVFILNFFNK